MEGQELASVSRDWIDFVIVRESLGCRRVKWSIARVDLGDSVKTSLFLESRMERTVADGRFNGFLLIFVIYRQHIIPNNGNKETYFPGDARG